MFITAVKVWSLLCVFTYVGAIANHIVCAAGRVCYYHSDFYFKGVLNEKNEWKKCAEGIYVQGLKLLPLMSNELHVRVVVQEEMRKTYVTLELNWADL